MSIENKIDNLTAAIEKLIHVNEALIALRTDAIERVEASSKTPSKSTKATETKTTETTSQATGEPADGVKKEFDECHELMVQYIKGTDRPEEREARKTKVQTLLRHKAIVRPEILENPPKKANGTDAYAVTDVLDEKVGVLKKNLNKLVSEGDITEAPAADTSEDNDLV